MNKLKGKSIGNKVFDVFNYSLLGIFAIGMIYPMWEMLTVSLMPAIEASSLGLKLFPKDITFNAYTLVFKSKLIVLGYKNTVFKTIVGTIISVFMCFCTAYPLAKKKLPARNMLTIFYLIPMFFGGGLIPSFLLVKDIGLYDTIWALIIPVLLSTYNILIMRNYIMSLPDSLEESALIDGAGFFRILIQIIIPLSMPILATIALWVAVAHWNSWFDAMIYTRSKENIVLQLVLRQVLVQEDQTSMMDDSLSGTESVIPRTVEAATIIVSIGPILLIYPFIQKYFIKGIMVGSLKG